MARVPIARNLVQQQPVTDAKFRAFDSGAEAIGEGVRDLGRSMGQAANDWDGIEAVHDETDARQNDLQHIEGARLIRQKVQQAKGVYAKPALDEAQKEYASLNKTLLEKARSPRAKALLEASIAKRTGMELGALGEYEIGETQKYVGGTLDARVAESGAEAGANYNNPELRDTYIATGLSDLEKLAEWEGIPKGSPLFEQKKRKFLDGVHTDIFDRIKADGNLDGALSYLDAKSGEISVGTEAKLRKELLDPLQERQAASNFARAVQLPNLADPDAPNEPGKGGPAVPVANGGDVIKALFPKARVTSTYRPSDHPLSKANPGSWHTKSHAAVDVAPIKGMSFEQYVQGVQDAGYTVLEAKNEVGSGRSAHATGDHWHIVLGKGGPQGAQQQARRWDKEDAYRRIDKLADAEKWDFEQRERTKRYADQQIARDENLISRKEADADRAASEWVIERGGNFTDISQMPRSMRDSLSPSDLRQYMNIAKSNAKPEGVKANGARATDLELMRIKDPDAFIKVPLGKFAAEMTPAEFQGLLVEQAKMAKGDPDKSIRSKVASTISTFGSDDGLSGKENASKRINVQKIMESELRELTGGKRNPSDDELMRAYQSATRDVTYKTTSFWGAGERTKPRFELGIDDVPADRRAKIIAGYRSTYGGDPTEEQIGEIFRNGKGRWW